MAKNVTTVVISANEQLDLCGSEFLDERDFDIEFEILPDNEFIRCTIDGRPNIFIEKSAILKLAAMIKGLEEG